MYSDEDYLPTIDAILKVSDLSQVSVKRIRRALEALFDVDLTEQKKRINHLIWTRYEHFLDLGENGSQDTESKIKKLEKENKEMAARLNQLLKKKDVQRVTKKARKSSTPQEASSSTSNPLTRGVLPSEALAQFLGSSEPIARTQVVKKIWEYVKANELQNPNDRREILCDDKLRPVFGDKVNMFTMNKVLVKHLFNGEDIVQTAE
ncbi:hypothetical protein KL918_002475 [Ogataea parapolymorpha]|uniref:Uncharacterized protein n=1 Tax=Ogataea parapolymorpha (strain ATCC 26012 / BCRC 20466 / JCM 22074 / NRRL Y-7560 / DL-1) TaxID=871575 RepID=W1QKI2_OGAPD|nr:hypothetical protein HPODL_02079 [Ogataea parapolymorpha DL-1]ESX02755.1 hypothetical protein HPODL_02079 [Ogataea parapolymorpha DL-1]KAG7867878.1 hypothetical protein KL918_002475 [Ogataea parapolymorpha]KAG7870682.1 hypothetical protein KL916_004730 [Ogataea parapolymorpha]